MYNIGVVILNYLAYEETFHCVNDFLKQDRGDRFCLKIIVVDNYSPNDSYKRLCDEFQDIDEVTVTQTNQNIGFARGNNFGYSKLKEYMEPDFTVISNSDIVIKMPNFFDWIIKCHEGYRFAVLGPSIFSVCGNYYQNPVKNYPTSYFFCVIRLLQLYVHKCQYLLLKTVNKRQETYISQWDNVYYQEVQRNLTLHGSLLIFSKGYFTFYQEPFHEQTFLYMEEDLLKLRCDRKKLLMLYEPSFEVLHLQSVSFNQSQANYWAKKYEKINRCIQSHKIYMKELIKQ